MRYPSKFTLVFVLRLQVLAQLSQTNAQDTPFCDICLCIFYPNEAPLINCIAEEIENVYDPNFWTDQNNDPYPIKKLKLQYNKLGDLKTKFALSNLKELDLGRNAISKLSTGIFGNLQEMSTLILSHNKISYIDPDVFKGNYEKELYFPLKALKALDLEYNELHTLHSDLFEHIDLLEELNVGHNPFKVIDIQTTQAINSLTYLKSLNLAYTQLKTLPEYFLHTPKNLITLDLSGNFIESIPVALQYSQITTLFLTKTRIAALVAHEPFPKTLRNLYLDQMPLLIQIGNESFTQCPNLKQLQLSKNYKLTVVEKDALAGLSVTRLVLRDCSLSTLSQDLVPDWSHQIFFDLTGNPWNCNCSLQWILNMNRSNNFLTKLRCTNPPEFKGASFYSLYQNQTKFKCDQSQSKVSRYTAIFLVLTTLVLIVLSVAVFYLRKRQKTITGPKFHIVADAH